jgi:hypothetical protein
MLLHPKTDLLSLNSYRLVMHSCVSSENFASLVVYYGELKTETITQQPAYDVQTFFSK